MRGELYAWARLRSARPLSAALFGGMSLLAAMTPPCVTWADESQSAAQTQPAAATASDDRSEKSIVISVGEQQSGDPDLAVVTDQTDECPLEPINRSTGAEPELAAGSAPTPAATAATGGVLETSDYGAEDDLDCADATAVASDAPEADSALAGEDSTTSETDALLPDASVVRAASFNGVTPGVSTREDLVVEWGEPASQNRGRLTYNFENFPRVDVQIVAGIVSTIHVVLPEPVDAPALIERLGLSELQPAVAASGGTTISTAFPERGVTLLHEQNGALAIASDAEAGAGDGEARVHEIELAGITAAPFLRRAAAAGSHDYGRQIADLEQALQLDGANAEAHYLLSAAKRAAGEAVEAEEQAAAAVELAETNDAYRLQRARCLKDLAQYDASVEETRKVLESAVSSKLVRAEALNLMGRLASLGSHEVQERVVPLHTKAIELADQLVNESDASVRRAAGVVLVDSHLAIAERLAAGKWQDKDETIAQWIARASAIAEQRIADNEGDEGLRLQVAVAALRAGAKLDPPIDPTLWIAEAEQAADAVKDKCNDDLGLAEVDWQLALAYSCATEIQHRRGEPDAALAFGDQAEQLMATLVVSRAELPDTAYIAGRLFFQIGAVHAVHRNDHAEACEWYERALEPLMTPTPVTPEATPGQHGDALVSMGVSFWEQHQRERAYELTKAGLELIEQGVKEGLLDSESLKVPEANLAAMGRVLGKTEMIAQTKAPVAPQTASPAQFAKRSSGGSAPQQRSASQQARRRGPTEVASRRTNDGTQRR